MQTPVSLFWFRRDLRLHDNHGLFEALRGPHPVQPVFIFDRYILDELEDRKDRRVEFIHRALGQIQAALRASGATLDVRYGTPETIFPELCREYPVQAVYTNHDYEPYARERDAGIAGMLSEKSIRFHSFRDQVIFEKGEVLKDDGKPYTVFTPYSRKWKTRLAQEGLPVYETRGYFDRFYPQSPRTLPTLQSMGFEPAGQPFPPSAWSRELILRYREQRDFPGLPGTSRLSVHLRFGTISIRELAREAGTLSETFLNELIWRDFYHMILWHFPRVTTEAFKPEYDRIPWRQAESDFAAWCEGRTGYPIVDAGMRELNATGFMHNRVRMIVASFLTKHLLIDWRRGEAWFAQKLLDYDLAANNGGWQWAAGCGCDAAPYFRVFNPYLQTKKFDPDLRYVRQWVPELEELSYPRPIVDHETARKRCLQVYSEALRK